MTKWRERNRARWFGIRPGHDGEQVRYFHSIANGTRVLYTVPVGKILLITSWHLCTATSVAGSGYIRTADAGAVVVQQIMRHVSLGAALQWSNGDRFFPYEVPAGHTVDLFSSAAGVSVYGGFDGLLIPA